MHPLPAIQNSFTKANLNDQFENYLKTQRLSILYYTFDKNSPATET